MSEQHGNEDATEQRTDEPFAHAGDYKGQSSAFLRCGVQRLLCPVQAKTPDGPIVGYLEVSGRYFRIAGDTGLTKQAPSLRPFQSSNGAAGLVHHDHHRFALLFCGKGWGSRFEKLPLDRGPIGEQSLGIDFVLVALQ